MRPFPLLLACVLLASVSASGAEVPKAEVPWITAKSKSTGARDRLEGTAVEVQLRFPTPPTRNYEIQAFFVARDPAGRQRVLYDAQRATARDQVKTHLFTPRHAAAGDFFGFDLSAYSGEPEPESTPKPIELPNDARFDGWIVRVVSAGATVRLEASHLALREWAVRSADALTERAGTIPREQKPDAAPAPSESPTEGRGVR